MLKLMCIRVFRLFRNGRHVYVVGTKSPFARGLKVRADSTSHSSCTHAQSSVKVFDFPKPTKKHKDKEESAKDE